MRIVVKDKRIKRKSRIMPLAKMNKRTKATIPSNKKKNHNKMQKLKKKKIKRLRNKKSNMRPKSYKKKLDQRSSMYLANMEWIQTF